MRHAYSNIYDLAHGFFYDPQDGERFYTNSASFIGNRFLSYGTCIGYIYEGKMGEKTLLVSDDNMSVTTAKHIRYLIGACPFSWIRVPFQYGESLSGMTQDQIVNHIKETLEYRLEREMGYKYTYTRAEQRDSSQHLLSMGAKFNEVTGATVLGLAKFKKYLDVKLSADNIKKAAARARKQAQIKAEKTRKALDKFRKGLKNTPIYPLIEKFCFDWTVWDKTEQEKKERELFINSFDVETPAFVRVDVEGGVVRTTKHVTLPIETIKPLLKMWKHKHNIVGLDCGQFKILANNDKMVKVGCHNIPVGNIQALCEIIL